MRRLVSAVCLGVLLSVAACAHPFAPTKIDPASPLAAVHVNNFAEVAPGVYRGANPDDAGYAALKSIGVKTVVDLRSGHDDGTARAHGLDVVHIPMNSFPKIADPTDAEVRRFLEVVTDPKMQPVYVHCAQGCDRTGVMCAIYRMEVDGWTADQALAEMRAFGWHEWWYGGLGRCVSSYCPHCLAKPEAAR